MIFKETKLKGAYLIQIEKHEDERGFFARAWCKKEFEEHGLNPHPVQANIASSQNKGTLRGLHYQIAPHEEVKLVHCIKGAIYDVIIDLRPDSPTFKQWIAVELTAENRKMLYVPEGFAHGFYVTSKEAEFVYKCTNYYDASSEVSINWNDKTLGIEWPLDHLPTLSKKDTEAISFEKLEGYDGY